MPKVLKVHNFCVTAMLKFFLYRPDLALFSRKFGASGTSATSATSAINQGISHRLMEWLILMAYHSAAD
jgi:hypothetical protein